MEWDSGGSGLSIIVARAQIQRIPGIRRVPSVPPADETGVRPLLVRERESYSSIAPIPGASAETFALDGIGGFHASSSYGRTDFSPNGWRRGRRWPPNSRSAEKCPRRAHAHSRSGLDGGEQLAIGDGWSSDWRAPWGLMSRRRWNSRTSKADALVRRGGGMGGFMWMVSAAQRNVPAGGFIWRAGCGGGVLRWPRQ